LVDDQPDYPLLYWDKEDSVLMDAYLKTVGKRRLYKVDVDLVDIHLPVIDANARDDGFDVSTRIMYPIAPPTSKKFPKLAAMRNGKALIQVGVVYTGPVN
jgi:hypothetical protein